MASQSADSFSATAAAAQAPATATAPMAPTNDMQALESQMLAQEARTSGAIRFVSSDVLNAAKTDFPVPGTNPDEIVLDSEEFEREEEIDVEEQLIPAAVFGSIAAVPK
jgi:hypothetical protein